MQDTGYLFVLAEVAVGFAGFASIVAVLGQRSARDHPELDAFRIRGLLECSLLVVIASLLPYAILRLGSGELPAWRLSSALAFVAAGLLTGGTAVRSRVISDIFVSRPIRLTITALYLAPLPFLLMTALGAFGDRGPGVYIAWLLSYLIAAAIGFYRVMVSFLTAVRG
jgi:hypothetical protein